MMRKRIYSLCMVLVMLLTVFSIPAMAANEIKVTIDGKLQTYDQMPVLKNSRVLVPMRGIFEALGANITWDEKTQTVTGKTDSKTVVLTIGETTATVNGNNTTLDVPAELINARTMVPVRFISEALGAQVAWEDATQTVVIETTTKPDSTSTPTPGGTTRKTFIFDDIDNFSLDTDYILGANYPEGNVSLSTEQDHTTGSGKSLKMAGRTKSDHRVKLLNVFSEKDVGKTFTISAWVYVPNLDKAIVTLATNSDKGTDYAFIPKQYISVEVPQAKWTEIKFEYKHEDTIVTQLGIDQRPASVKCADVIYVDDIKIVEGAFGNSVAYESSSTANPAPTTPTTPTTPTATGGLNVVKNAKGTIDSLNFDNSDGIKDASEIERGGGYPYKGISISSEQDHTTGSGKSLKMAERNESYYRVKLADFFSPADKGKTYTVKCWVYIPDVDTQVRLGAYSKTGTEFAMTGDNLKTFVVKKGEWTEITYEYKLTKDIVTFLGFDQPNGVDTAPTIYIDDITVTVN